MFDLNIFQSEALREIGNAEKSGERKVAIVMPTGTGKTYLIAEWFKTRLYKNPSAGLLYICHNQDILTQANEKEFTTHLKDLDISCGYYNASEKSIAQITFATVQTLSKNMTRFSPDHFDYIVIDEAHHYRAKTFEDTVRYFTPKLLIGLTATPNRMDKKSILKIFDRIIYTARISTGIRDGLLSKIRYYCVDDDIDFSDLRWNGRSYNENDLNKKLCIPEYDRSILKEYLETVRRTHNKTKTICFCATVEHAYRMKELFNKNNIKAIALTGKSRTNSARAALHGNRRAQIIDGFRNGDYEIIFVRDLFNEGVDIPDADSIMMLRPTQSDTIFTQQLGRGLRVSPTKDYLLVLDFTGNCHNCSINIDVLDELMDVDITKEVLGRMARGDSSQEVIIRNLGCEIRLSKKKIDVINGVITKEKLISNYQSVKAVLSRQPLIRDIDSHEISQYGRGNYETVFGSWNKFLLEINEPINKTNNISREQLISNYYSVKAKLSHQPMMRDVDNREISQYSSVPYFRRFGSWNKFLLEINEPVNRTSDVSREQLISNYYSVKAKLSRQPRIADIDNCEVSQYSSVPYYRRFGSWNKFLLGINEPMNCGRSISKEQLISNYRSVKAKLSRQPTLKDINNHEVSQYGVGPYRNQFRSWNKFLLEINEPVNIIQHTNISNEQLISNYYSVKAKLSRQPRTTDINNHEVSLYSSRTYADRFGSWNDFLLEINEPANRTFGVSKEPLISNYYSVKAKLSRQPRTVDIDNREISQYGRGNYEAIFGSWSKFLLEINEPVYNARKTTKKHG